MQQHPVPQNIMAVEFQLVGSMTIKQFIYVAAAAVIDGVIYASPLYDFIKWPLIAIFALIGLGLAFVPINDLPLDRWIVAFINSVSQPTKRIWRKEPKSLDYLLPNFAPAPTKNLGVNLSPDRTKLDQYLNTFRNAKKRDDLEDYEKKFLAGLDFGSDPKSPTTPTAPISLTSQPPKDRVSVIAEVNHPGRLASAASTAVAAHHTAEISTYISKVGNSDHRSINPHAVNSVSPKIPGSGLTPTVPQALLEPKKQTTPERYTEVSPLSFAAAPPRSVPQTISPITPSGYANAPVWPGQPGAPAVTPTAQTTTERAEVGSPVGNEGNPVTKSPTRGAVPDFMQSPASRNKLVGNYTDVKPEPVGAVEQPVAPTPAPVPANNSVEELEKRLAEMQAKIKHLETQASAPVATPTVPTPAVKEEPVKPEVKFVPQPASAVLTPPPAPIEIENFQPKIMAAVPAIGRLAPPRPDFPNVISGWVRDQKGQLLSDIIITIKDASSRAVRALKSNKIGRFAITTPLPDGTYLIDAEKKGYNFDVTEITLDGKILSPIEIKTVN